jgi:hypothetical protein
MAIRGFFSETRLVFGNPASITAVPYVRTFVELSPFGTFAEVTFLVDTGADMTVLNPQDGLRLIPPDAWARLTNPIRPGGAGAGLDHFPLQANVYFVHDDGRVEVIASTVYVASAGPANVRLESLLGRDVLANFVVTFDQAGKNLTLA